MKTQGPSKAFGIVNSKLRIRLPLHAALSSISPLKVQAVVEEGGGMVRYFASTEYNWMNTAQLFTVCFSLNQVGVYAV